jgi:isopentenyl-diphosphate delta-isomerase
LDAAKLAALGAEMVGFARPAIEAAIKGAAALDDWMAQLELEFRIALFCAGARAPQDLRAKYSLLGERVARHGDGTK